MEKQQNPERISPEIAVSIGSRIVYMTYYNAEVYYYNENYNHVRHVFFKDEDGEGAYIFNTDLADELVAKEFPSHYQPWPEPIDEDAYVRSKVADMEERLKDDDLNL